jgi:hypothetical protein
MSGAQFRPDVADALIAILTQHDAKRARRQRFESERQETERLETESHEADGHDTAASEAGLEPLTIP